jgi:hypothetical protein
MEGYRALRTATHLIEPLGYGILRKTVNRGAPVHSASEQYRIHTVASLFESQWITIVDPLRLESSRSYTLSELVDCTILTEDQIWAYMKIYPLLKEEWTRFVLFIIGEGYFPRGMKLLRCTTGTPFRILDVSLFGHVQGDFVRFPDKPWTYSIIQSELLYGIV